MNCIAPAPRVLSARRLSDQPPRNLVENLTPPKTTSSKDRFLAVPTMHCPNQFLNSNKKNKFPSNPNLDPGEAPIVTKVTQECKSRRCSSKMTHSELLRKIKEVRTPRGLHIIKNICKHFGRTGGGVLLALQAWSSGGKHSSISPGAPLSPFGFHDSPKVFSLKQRVT